MSPFEIREFSHGRLVQVLTDPQRDLDSIATEHPVGALKRLNRVRLEPRLEQ
jgi:hypothetical protein